MIRLRTRWKGVIVAGLVGTALSLSFASPLPAIANEFAEADVLSSYDKEAMIVADGASPDYVGTLSSLKSSDEAGVYGQEPGTPSEPEGLMRRLARSTGSRTGRWSVGRRFGIRSLTLGTG